MTRLTLDIRRRAATNTGFASGGVTCKLGALCFVSSVVQVTRERYMIVLPVDPLAPAK